MAAEKPRSIGKYDVLDVIGRGGMGIVYKAKDPQLGRLVAIKMMTGGFDDKPEHLRRFFREAQSTASLQHPNIVTVYALGDYTGNPYLVMEYLEGHSLDVFIAAQQPLRLLEKLNIIVDVCQGLGYAHQRAIIHRDIKPGNIMVLADGSVKIVDFGIAHIGGKHETRTGQVIGSISYMSPEQINSKPVDRRTDIFSTGVVLYQLLTYSLPFEGENTAATLLKIVHEPPPPLSKFLPIFPPELESIILRALSKDREERYSSADEFAVDLGRVRDQVRQEILSQHLEQASTLLDQNELQKAKEQVLEILKIDRHHTRASHLLREIQQRMERQQVYEQVRQLTEQAQQSFAGEDFEKALAYLDRALPLADDKLPLETLRQTIQSAWQHAQNVDRLLEQAQVAYQQGDLDLAKQVIDQLCEQAPDNPNARALQTAIGTEWAEHARQRQIEQYVREARRDITFRRFTAALQILKNAQALDPHAPQVLALLESASAGQEQEEKRRELDALSREIEDALSRDEYSAASQLAREGLTKFVDEPRLLKLLDLAERQRRSRERKQYIDEQLTSARKLLEQGRSEQLVALLETALNKVGPDTTLESLLRAVREQRERERLEKRKNDYLQSAKDQLRQKDYAAAVRTLEAARTELKDNVEIEDLLQFVRGEALREERRQKLATTAERVREMTAAKQYREAITLLETTLSQIPDEELGIVLAETRNAAAEYEQKLEATLASTEKLLRDRKPSEALRLLESENSWFTGDPRFQKLSGVAHAELKRVRQIQQAIADADKLARDGQFDPARRHLQELESQYGRTPELDEAITEVDRLRALSDSKEVEKALADGRTLVDQGQFATTIVRLASVTHLLSAVPAGLRRAHDALEGEAATRVAQQLRTEIETQIAAGDITRAQEILERTCTNLPPAYRFVELEELLQKEVKRKAEASQALEKAHSLLEKADWSGAAELLLRAHRGSAHAPDVRAQLAGEFLRAVECALKTDWRSSEQVLKQFTELEPNYRIPIELLTKIADAKKEEAVAACLEEGMRLERSGSLGRAREEVSRFLAAYPADPRLEQFSSRLDALIQQEADRARQEKQRQQQESRVLELLRAADQEPGLDRKVSMLREGLAKYPKEARIEQSLSTALELQEQLSRLVNQAQAHETEKKYEKAIRAWQAVGAAYSRYPEVEAHLRRLRQLSEEARAEARRDLIQKLEDAVAAGDFELVSRISGDAKQEFPGDADLNRIDQNLELGLKRRAKAEKALADARRCFWKHRWDAGGKAMIRAFEAGKQDPVLWKQAVQELLVARDLAMGEDSSWAERILRKVSELGSKLPLPELAPNGTAELPQQPSGPSWMNKLRSAVSSMTVVARDETIAAGSTPEPGGEKAEPNPPSSPGESTKPSKDLDHREGGRVLEFPTVVDLRGRVAKASGGELVASNAGPVADVGAPASIAMSSDTRMQPEAEPRGLDSAGETRLLHPSALLSEPTRLDSSRSFRWPEDTLRVLERQLTTLIGPVARILVKRAAAKTTDFEELYRSLLASLDKPSDREKFLRGKATAAKTLSSAQLTPEAEPSGLTRMAVGSAAGELTREAIEGATRALAHYVGPISSVLVKRAARRADSVRTLYLILAEHVNEPDRARFLKNSGFADS